MTKNLLFILLLLWGSMATAQNKFVPFSSSNLRYEGRVSVQKEAAELIWSGTSVYMKFEGESVSAILKDLDTANYYNVIIDKKVAGKIHPDTTKRTYLLASGLKKGVHELQLFKRTEWDKGKTLFFGFEVPQAAKLLAPPAAPKRKIEFYGNSITCGYAIEDFSGKDRGIGYCENNYLTYAALTARHFDAQYYCNSKSGIGILVSWFPLIMSEMYDRLDPTDSTSKWDFKKYTPDIVVINLFQNDSWIVKMPKNEQFKHRFGTKEPEESTIILAYKNFVSSIRNKYPKATIICALGNMDATREGSLWPNYVKEAVSQLKDAKIHTHIFPYKNTPGHPNIAEQETMAKSLIGFIEKNIKW
jgi:hypothetical protein